MDPIFIIGTERSGTNLLRLILNAHPSIAIPHPPHIMKNFFPLEPLYGDLAQDARFKRLIRDVARMVRLHPYPWEIRLDQEKIFRDARGRSLIHIFYAIYDQYLENTGKKRWGCKSTFMIHHVALIRQTRPSAKFIYMARDARDVALSAKKTIFNHYSVYYTARLWKKEQEMGLAWRDALPVDEIHLLRYEDLLRCPEDTVKALCAFLSEPYVPDMLDFFKTDEARKSGSLCAAWKNTSRPILQDNASKFKAALSDQEISLIEAIAGPEMSRLSYALTKPAPCSEEARLGAARFKIIYALEEAVLLVKVQVKHFFTDKNSFLRMKKFLFLKFLKFFLCVGRGRR